MATPFSYRIYIGDGTNDLFSIPFPYLDKTHIKVFVNGTETTAFTWSTSSTIKLNSKPGAGVRVKVQRITPRDARLVDFADGTNFTEADLDMSANQMFYVVQETFDSITALIQQDNTGTYWDALGLPLSNLGEAVADTDAVTNRYYMTVMLPAMHAIQTAVQGLKNDTQGIRDATELIRAATAVLQGQAAASQTAAHNSEVAAAGSASAAAASAAAAAVSEANSYAAVPAATTTVAGKVQLAVNADVAAGVNTTKATTPAQLKTMGDSKVGLSLFGAAWDFVVGSGSATAVKKTASEVWTYLTSLVGAYTKQQYAVPVALTGQSGTITLDADIHQDLSITATGNITLAAPANPVFGKTIFLTLYSSYALTITWHSIFKGNADFTTLDSAFVAGKRLFLQFRYVENVGWVLMGRAQEA